MVVEAVADAEAFASASMALKLKAGSSAPKKRSEYCADEPCVG